MNNEPTLKRIDELRKCETLKKQYACLLYNHHRHIKGCFTNAMHSAFRAAEELLKDIYPFEHAPSAGICGYIASTWPNDRFVFDHYLLLKEAEAQGEFLPNKAQSTMFVMNLLDELAEKIRSTSKRSKEHREAKSLRETTLETSAFLHNLMGWKALDR